MIFSGSMGAGLETALRGVIANAHAVAFDGNALMRFVARLGSEIIAAAAIPFLVFGLLFNLGLGVLSRLMPQMQVFFVGMPASILIGFLVLLLVIGAMISVFHDYLAGVLRQLAPYS